VAPAGKARHTRCSVSVRSASFTARHSRGWTGRVPAAAQRTPSAAAAGAGGYRRVLHIGHLRPRQVPRADTTAPEPHAAAPPARSATVPAPWTLTNAASRMWRRRHRQAQHQPVDRRLPEPAEPRVRNTAPGGSSTVTASPMVIPSPHAFWDALASDLPMPAGTGTRRAWRGTRTKMSSWYQVVSRAFVSRSEGVIPTAQPCMGCVAGVAGSTVMPPGCPAARWLQRKPGPGRPARSRRRTQPSGRCRGRHQVRRIEVLEANFGSPDQRRRSPYALLT
jgi:hypothetical protein